MANRKKNHRWNQVMPGDIISFKYGPKSKAKPIKTQTILVLNPKITVKLKNGKTTKQLIGIKIEESNRQILAMSKIVINLFQKIGEFRIIDKGNSIYHLQIKQTFLINEFVGVKQEVFRMLVKLDITSLLLKSTLIGNNSIAFLCILLYSFKSVFKLLSSTKSAFK